MLHYAMMLLVVAPTLAGCAMDTGALEGGEIGALGEAEGEVNIHNELLPNHLNPNGLSPNGLSPNGLSPNALSPESISAESMKVLRAPGPEGDAAREFMKYAVSCAFDAEHSFEFTWWDGAENRVESYPGALGLATEWQSGALSEDGQEWVSACMAARANHYRVSVLISMRNTASDPALTADPAERGSYSYREGAFWGNIFSTTPRLYSCFDSDNRDHARAKLRVCAAGYVEGEDTRYCDNIQSAGSCASACAVSAQDPANGYLSCGADAEVITTYLD